MQDKNFTTVITFLSAKGGIGKTILAINLAYLLMRDGAKVLIIDTNFRFPSVDILLGKSDRVTVDEVLKDKKLLLHAIEKNEDDIYFLSISQNFKCNDEIKELNKIISELKHLKKHFDFIIIDTSLCFNDRYLQLILHSDKNILVVSPELASLSNSYLLLKNIISRTSVDIYLLINKVESEREAKDIFQDLNSLVRKTLRSETKYLGSVRLENELFNYSKYKSLYVKEFPISNFSKDLGKIKNRITEGLR
jgi:flagellar biosynthesis protein FlhG